MVDALRVGYAVAAGLVALAAFHDAPGRLRRAHEEGRVLEGVGYHAANAASILLVAAWLTVLVLGWDRSLPWALPARALLRWCGFGVALAGFGLAAWARRALGSAFVPTAAVPADERIVDVGPYAHVRHPFYVGLVLALAGGVLALDSLATLVCLVAMVLLVRAIAVREERHLVEEIGVAYEDYTARVPRWLPRLRA